MNKLIDFVRLLRIHQWHKNSFVLLGFFVLGDYGNYELLFKSLLAAFVFCLVSSSVYIFNDFRDINYDRRHPLKKNRPLADERINVTPALMLSAVFCLAGIFLSFSISTIALIVIVLYLLNNLSYSIFLKNYAIVDVFQIGLGFMLRIFAGTAGIGIYISEWMILTGFMISLFIGFSKRYAELNGTQSRDISRRVLKDYSVEILKAFIIIMAASTIITYSLYTLSPRSVELHGSTNLIYTIPFVVFGVFRFLYLVMFHDSGDDPTSLVLKDSQLIVTTVLWAITYSVIIS